MRNVAADAMMSAHTYDSKHNIYYAARSRVSVAS